jgi:hypothetical protein
VFKITLTGDVNLSFLGGFAGETPIILIITQDNVGGHVVTFDAHFKGNIPNGLTANKTSVFEYVFDGTNCLLTGLPVLDQ